MWKTYLVDESFTITTTVLVGPAAARGVEVLTDIVCVTPWDASTIAVPVGVRTVTGSAVAKHGTRS
jgi:hypothetical protein